jgi:hypothetical protein
MRIVPAVAVYASATPPMVVLCCVTHVLASGIGGVAGAAGVVGGVAGAGASAAYTPAARAIEQTSNARLRTVMGR